MQLMETTHVRYASWLRFALVNPNVLKQSTVMRPTTKEIVRLMKVELTDREEAHDVEYPKHLVLDAFLPGGVG